MKKDYNDLANNQNTPHLWRNTQIIRLCWFFLGVNSLIFGITEQTGKAIPGAIIIGVCLFVLSWVCSIDIRRKERNVATAIIDLLIWLALTIYYVIFSITNSGTYVMLIAFVLEASVNLFFIRGYKK